MKFDFRILRGEVAYTGLELRSGWVAEQTGLDGDAAAGFVGPCHVPTEHLVDLDDARAGTFIRAASMAHAIVEHPGCALGTAVLRQRLLVCILAELIAPAGPVRRDGDDLYYSGRKLTVSIAAPGPRSSLIHLGINVDPDGAPVPAVGLRELGLDAGTVLEELLRRYARELASMAHAAIKVRTVT
ncbi:MAG TPA: DUF366 family protein [Candidatus Krumholzibacteria bacterium]|nr:DUF366 family protein [Candidatus Krumholzibacteria bacterium]